MSVDKSFGNGAFAAYNENMKKRGFTLIELLVVIAILGIIATMVLSQVNKARIKSRDARRLSDLKEMKLALSVFFDANRRYPTDAEWAANQLASDTAPNCNGKRCMPIVPKDPRDGTLYPYYRCSETMYHLGANLEMNNNPVLRDDYDTTGELPAECAATTIDSPDADGCANESGRYCYDTTP